MTTTLMGDLMRYGTLRSRAKFSLVIGRISTYGIIRWDY